MGQDVDVRFASTCADSDNANNKTNINININIIGNLIDH